MLTHSINISNNNYHRKGKLRLVHDMEVKCLVRISIIEFGLRGTQQDIQSATQRYRPT